MTGARGDNTLPMFTGKMILKSRANFSHFHRIAAYHAHQQALDIEYKYNLRNEIPPDRELDLYVSLVSTCIICSVSAIESSINEFIVDNESEIDKALSKNHKCTLKQLYAKTNAFWKFNILWFLKYGNPYPEDDISIDVNYLIDIRNELTHFKPEWNNSFSKHADLEDRRTDKQFLESPFFPKDAFFMPHRCLSSTCASWAILACNDFLKMFALHMQR